VLAATSRPDERGGERRDALIRCDGFGHAGFFIGDRQYF